MSAAPPASQGGTQRWLPRASPLQPQPALPGAELFPCRQVTGVRDEQGRTGSGLQTMGLGEEQCQGAPVILLPAEHPQHQHIKGLLLGLNDHHRSGPRRMPPSLPETAWLSLSELHRVFLAPRSQGQSPVAFCHQILLLTFPQGLAVRILL